MLSLLDDATCRDLLHLVLRESVTGYALVKEDGTFLWVNPAFCKITEFSLAELKRKKYQDITDPSDLEADVEMAHLVAKGDFETYEMNKSYITKTKKMQPVFLRVTALRTKGAFTFFVAQVAAIDRSAQCLPENGEIRTAVRRNLLFKFLKEYKEILLITMGGVGLLLGYATGILHPVIK